MKGMKPGDYLLCYLVGISRFIGLLEVVSEPYEDDSPIWSAEAFPLRVRVNKLVELTPETAVPINDLIPSSASVTRTARCSGRAWCRGRRPSGPRRMAS